MPAPSSTAEQQFAHRHSLPFPDPLSYLERVAVKLHTMWLGGTFPFRQFGSGVSIHYSCEIPRQMSPRIAFGNSVFLAKDVWLNLVDYGSRSDAGIILGDGSSIGRHSVISAKNQILLEADVLLAPSVLIMDHNHNYSDPDVPIRDQGATAGGTITIGRNCWLGYGCAVLCNRGDLVLGRNTIVGANSVVTQSFPPFSVVAGAPAQLIRRFDEKSRQWIKVQ